MAQITVKDFKEIITDPDRVRIISDNKIIWSGWGCDIPEKYKEETVKKFRSVPELRHKKWQELGLMKPFEGLQDQAVKSWLRPIFGKLPCARNERRRLPHGRRLPRNQPYAGITSLRRRFERRKIRNWRQFIT